MILELLKYVFRAVLWPLDLIIIDITTIVIYTRSNRMQKLMLFQNSTGAFFSLIMIGFGVLNNFIFYEQTTPLELSIRIIINSLLNWILLGVWYLFALLTRDVHLRGMMLFVSSLFAGMMLSFIIRDLVLRLI